jgi:hypothetical protein
MEALVTVPFSTAIRRWHVGGVLEEIGNVKSGMVSDLNVYAAFSFTMFILHK